MNHTVFSNNTNVDNGNVISYAEIDMSIGADGTVASKNNVMLSGDTGEAIDVLPHTNGKDYWVLAYDTAGMVKAFQVIQAKAGALSPVSPGDLAGGIWEALLTTVGGLAVAIPVIVAYNFLVAQVDTFIINMERAMVELMQALKGES